LKGEGLDISTPTLKSYLQKAKAEAKAKAKAKSIKKDTSKTSSTSSTQPDSGSEDISSITSKAEDLTDNKKVRSSGSFAPRPDSVDL
jgi:hypothetical protein